MSSLSENILLLICGLGILQGILLAALIYFHPKSDRSVNAFLAMHILFISIAMTMPFTVRLITWQKANLMQPVLLLPAIFLYFYIRSFRERLNFKNTAPHFLIVFLFFIAVFWNTFIITAKYGDAKVPPKEVFYQPFNFIIPIIQICLKLFYCLLTMRTLLSYQRSIQQLFSETSRIDLIWARTLVSCYIFLVVAGVIMFICMMRFPEHFNLLLIINVVMGTPYIYFATYKGVSQPTIWQLQPGTTTKTAHQEEVQVRIINTDQPRASKGGLSEEKIHEIDSRIIFLFEKEKLYQETELTLQQLADKLQLHAYQVSQAINEGMKKNFYDLINGYRVEEAKRLLLDSKNENYTILSVGFEAGFNSKTTFNTVFKKFTGVTPTEYRGRKKLISAEV